MQISVYDNATPPNEFLLAAEGQEGYSGLRISHQTEMQPLKFIRATHAKPEDRGNTITTIEFSVHPLKTSYSNADLYALELRQNTPRQGLIKLERKSGDIIDFQRFFKDGVVHLVSVEPRGASLVETWRLTVGELLTELELI